MLIFKDLHKYSGIRPLLAYLFIIILCYACAKPADRWKAGIAGSGFIFTQAPFPSCHAATIAETRDGLIAAWFGGTHERHPDVGIWVSRMVNGQWTPPEEVANGRIDEITRYPLWNPVLYQVPGGELYLFYKIGPRPSAWWGMMKRSTDAGKTWSDPEPLPAGFIGPVKNKPVLLDNGTLLCGSSTEGDAWRVHMEKTDTEARHWTKTDALNDGETYQAIQPSILTYRDGSLQILCRSRNAVIVESWSFDGGETWSLLQDAGLPNNNSGFDGVTLADGRQLLVYNHVSTPAGAGKGYRTPLNVAVKKGKSKYWYAALILEDSLTGQYSYPSVIQSADGMVHIVYTWRRERIMHVVIDPDKIKLQKITAGQWPG